jgi:hypothetical protein
VEVNVRMRGGQTYSQVVDPMKTLEDLYDSLHAPLEERPIVRLDFQDVPDEEIHGKPRSSSRSIACEPRR